MVMAMMIWAWAWNDRYLAGRGGRRTLAAAALCELVISYSHGIGVLMNSFLVSYGVLLWLDGQTDRQRFRCWMKTQALVGVLSLGGLANGLVRNVTHTFVPDLSHVRSTFADYWFGNSWGASSTAGWIGMGLCLLLGSLVLTFRRGRITLLALWLGPLIVTFLISLLVRPIWHLHAILFTVPFAALGIALSIDNLPFIFPRHAALLRRTLCGGTLLTAAAFSVHHVRTFEKQTNYRWVVDEIERQAEPSDIVYVPHGPDFWGVARYAVGPDWGSPLNVQSCETCADRWGELLEALGPLWRQRLHLEPETCMIEHDGVRYVIGECSQDFIDQTAPSRVLLVRTRSEDNDALSGYRATSQEMCGNIQLIVFDRTPGTGATPQQPAPLGESWRQLSPIAFCDR